MHIEAISLTRHPLPVPATPRSAGLDLKATEYAAIPAGGRALIKTGIKLAIPDGFAGLICPRSGLALKHGVTVLNAPGVLDADYRGEVGVILANFGELPFIVEPGDRIAQLVLVHYRPALLVEVGSLDETERGEGGFGHTGIR